MSRQAVELLCQEGQAEWSTEKPAPGAEPGPRELFISVGSRSEALPAHPRMLSWKLPQWVRRSARSSTSVALMAGAELDAFAAEGTAGPPRLRIHEPTLDATSAVLLAVYRMRHGRFPEGAEALSQYVDEWEQGQTELAGEYERALGPVFYAALRLWPAQKGRPAREVLVLLASVLEHVRSAAELRQLPEALIPSPVSRRLKADALLYRAELSRAQRVQLDIPVGDAKDAPVRRVDALFLSSFQDVTVLKLLARADTEHSHYGQGFDFMAIHAPNAETAYYQHTFSLAPERAGHPGGPGGVAGHAGGRAAAGRRPSCPRAPGASSSSPTTTPIPGTRTATPSATSRSTLVAPPYAGTRLTRRELWEALWSRYNVGRNVPVLRAHTVYARPFLWKGEPPEAALLARGFRRRDFSEQAGTFHPAVTQSFLGSSHEADVAHYERPAEGQTVHVSVYPEPPRRRVDRAAADGGDLPVRAGPGAGGARGGTDAVGAGTAEGAEPCPRAAGPGAVARVRRLPHLPEPHVHAG